MRASHRYQSRQERLSRYRRRSKHSSDRRAWKLPAYALSYGLTLPQGSSFEYSDYTHRLHVFPRENRRDPRFLFPVRTQTRETALVSGGASRLGQGHGMEYTVVEVTGRP